MALPVARHLVAEAFPAGDLQSALGGAEGLATTTT